MINTIIYGLTYAFSQAVVYFVYPLVFRFGAFQIALPSSNVASASFDQIIVVFFALLFGAAGAGQAGAFAPNYSKAKLSASRIFHLMDRVPEIDSYSEDGEKLVSIKVNDFISNISCLFVCFVLSCSESKIMVFFPILISPHFPPVYSLMCGDRLNYIPFTYS